MGKLMLTQSRLKEVLSYDPETGLFTRVSTKTRYKAGSVSGSPQNKGYVQIMIDSYNYLAHRLAWLYVYGEFPKGQIDHINRIKTDNRIANLRDVDNSINQLNIGVRKHNSSGVTGVMKDTRSNKWVVQLIFDNKRHYLGRYETVAEAKIAREEKEKELMRLKLQVHDLCV
tara:strand:- start:75 stop:587 length:513 start_codon:yes stop_codon:yes gene_type:complete